jgi:hypothetical protein
MNFYNETLDEDHLGVAIAEIVEEQDTECVSLHIVVECTINLSISSSFQMISHL